MTRCTLDEHLNKRTPSDAPRAEVRCDDISNAERLVAQQGDCIRWMHTRKRWIYWDGRRWATDDTDFAMRCAKATARSIYGEAQRCDSDGEAKEIARWADRSASAQRLHAMLKLAKSEDGITIGEDNLDRDPTLLNCMNGTLDLRTGELRAHDRNDLISKLAPVAYDAAAKCPRWDAFLDRICDGNGELRSFIQRAVGYTLTGLTGERSMFILHGSGANGKSVFTSVIRDILGDYAATVPASTFLARRDDGPRNDIAGLTGIRLAVGAETTEGRSLNEGLVKLLTGGSDRVSARFLFGEWFEFLPTFKLWLHTNHRPVVKGDDNAIWDRLKLVPFTVTIPPGERDAELPEKLAKECRGILAWAVRGCTTWWKDGLGIPDEVIAAVDDYRSESDIVGRFLGDCCVLNDTASATAKDLYREFREWSEREGEPVMSQKRFGGRLRARGFDSVRLDGRGPTTWIGIGLLAGEKQGFAHD
ncbi:MAG: hypothetical protein KAS72_13975 [Phycisphaerales bacterium]|nr:hypothetical protein [Phycisphaerales bacterium]